MKRTAIAWMVCFLTAPLLTGCETLRSAVDMVTPSTQSVAAKDTRKALADFQPTATVTTRWQVKTDHDDRQYNRIFPYQTESAIFVAGGKTVSAWNKSGGTALWKAPVAETVTGGVNGGGGQVFVGTADGSAIALNAADGQVQWAQRLSSEVLSVSNTDKGKVIFRTADGKLNALSTSSGELIWQRKKPTPPLTLRGAGVPLVAGGLVVAGFDDGAVTAYALDTGKGLWEAILSVPRGSNDIEKITDVDGRLKILGAALFATSYQGSLSGIDMQSGKAAWSNPFSSLVGVEANPQGLYAINHQGELWRFDPQSGKPIWKSADLQTRSPTTPTLTNEYLVIGDFEGYLHWLHTETGKIAGRLRSDPAGYNVPPLVDGNVVYSFGKNGILAAHTLQ